jgi:hypothetical protein
MQTRGVGGVYNLQTVKVEWIDAELKEKRELRIQETGNRRIEPLNH